VATLIRYGRIRLAVRSLPTQTVDIGLPRQEEEEGAVGRGFEVVFMARCTQLSCSLSVLRESPVFSIHQDCIYLNVMYAPQPTSFSDRLHC
jgi:hypothetical protein